MFRYLAYRLVGLVLMVLVVEFLTTAMMEVIPGSYCSSQLPDHASIETRQSCREHEPGLFEKYLIGLKNLAEFNLGYSWQGSHRAISLELSDHLPATLWLGSISGFLGLGLGIIGGVLAARGRRRWWGGLINGLAIGMLALPTFILAFVLRYILVFRLNWFHILEDAAEWRSLVMPVLAIALPLSAWFMRLTRAAIMVELGRDYTRTARAKGLPEWRISVRHILRNALSAIIPLIGLVFVGMVDGVLLIEIIFNRPGLGRYTLNAVIAQDFPALQGVILLIAIFTVTINLAADLVYAWLFPQSRSEILPSGNLH